MKAIRNSSESIGLNYPVSTGRLKQVGEQGGQRVALIGDSTLDNGYWVQQNLPYAQRTATVTHQTALALAVSDSEANFLVANFAVDGATTSDLLDHCRLDKVLPTDEDHPDEYVTQLFTLSMWNPDVVVLSVAGNNYREALQSTLISELGYKKLVLRSTPEEAKQKIAGAFKEVKAKLLKEYKDNIDVLSGDHKGLPLPDNFKMKRLVIMSQYYPELTQFTPYMIYTGFSHVARAEGQTKCAFEAMENTMNELYREILAYAIKKNTQVVYVDVASSLSPLGGNHTLQIEPNLRGAKELGGLIAKAVTLTEMDNNYIIKKEGNEIIAAPISEDEIKNYSIKKIEKFIQESRYSHVGLFFSPNSNLKSRFESAYHMLVGKQFDAQYTGLFAFGLLDASLITVMAQYLWRAALNDENGNFLRVAAAVTAVPILMVEQVVALAVLLVLSIPIIAYHKLAQQFASEDPEPNHTENGLLLGQ